MNDEVVISGISGRFPESFNIEEFKQNLFDGVDMVTDDDRRWPSGLYNLPPRMGKLKNLEHFDASFFGVHAKQANFMDPQLRIMLELTHEALIDAGVNPTEARGSRTGVFIGATNNESFHYWTSDPSKVYGYVVTGCTFSMFANRISYTFDFNGPSYTIDTACSSSLYAFQQAVTAIKSGQCDSAIVGGVNLLLQLGTALQFHSMNMLSPTGLNAPFDESTDGYVRAEGAVIIYLQKANTAKRIYATVVGAKTNTDGYKVEGITYPIGAMQKKLITDLYEEVGIDPAEVTYIEAHGTGTKAGDPEELNSIADAFCKNKKKSLLIGSVKSNMGHSEPAAGLCSIAKIIIGMETGIIPGNLHFKNPNPNIPALLDGRLKVVTKNQSWNGGYVGINSFGFGGANAHVVLKSYSKTKLKRTVATIPRLFTVSGRTPDAVNTFLNKLERFSNDDELMALIHDIHSKNINGHDYRGYNVIGDKVIREVNEVTREKRPIWFVFSGMGSQWSGMCKDMMHLDTFKNSINKCAHILKPYGINVEELITTSNESLFENEINTIVGIIASQIALYDVLISIGIHPDGIVGHSLGEISCAYADGSFSFEQAILVALERGKAVVESDLPVGAMSAVGLSWEKCKTRCPSNVFPACHNSIDNVTISGIAESVKKFVDELSVENIFVRNIKGMTKAYHTKYVADAVTKFHKSLETVIPNPKPRTSRWISTSIPKSNWKTPLAQLSSPAYHANNMLSPVLFHEAVQHIPENAIVIEIAPHCILQAILKRSLGPNTTYIGVMKQGHKNNLEFFMSNLGNLYNAGTQPQVKKLYQPVSYPVGCGTPMLQSMIEWDHSTKWAVADYFRKAETSGETVVEVDLNNENDQYLAGHIVDGRILFPATGYMSLVWKTFSNFHSKDYEKLPVIFENVQFYRATIMPRKGTVKFLINILKGTGDFEIREGGSVVASGRIYVSEDINKEMLDLPKPIMMQKTEFIDLNNSDIYKELLLRGYNYEGIFKGIYKSDNRGNSGVLKWKNNWVSFIDTMLQFAILGETSRNVQLPTRLQKIIINPKQHLEYISALKNKGAPEHVPVYMYRDISVVKSIGIEIRDWKTSIAPKRPQVLSNLKLEKYVYVPYENNSSISPDDNKARNQSLGVLLQTVIENSQGAIKLKVSELSNDCTQTLLGPTVVCIIESEPMLSVDYTVIVSDDVSAYQAAVEGFGGKVVQKDITQNVIDQNINLIIAKDVLSKNNIKELNNIVGSLKQESMILLVETKAEGLYVDILTKFDLELVSKHVVGEQVYLLLKKSVEISSNTVILQISENNFSWVEPLKDALKKSKIERSRIYLVVQNEELTGIMGLTTCILREHGGQNVRSIFIQDKNSERFSLTSPFFVKQLKKDLVFNVLKNGTWGSFRHILLDNATDTGMLRVEHAYIDTLTRGDLSSLKWIESPLNYYKNDNQNAKLCSVYYAPLNFRDIMLASGKLPPDALPVNLANQKCILGLEFSGRNSEGRRVMGMVIAKSLATTVLSCPEFLWEVPEKWSLEEASTVPVAYATSYYALVIRGRMTPGESVLIHAGTGGVGQAAITIALHMGCTVFTTVGTQVKRNFIKQQFPQLKDTHIGNSRDTSFEHMIRQETNGKGVDLVLNSLAEEKLQASVRCLAQHGRFLEIGKVDFSNNNPLGMSIFLKNITFHGILVDTLFSANTEDKKVLFNLVAEGIKKGVVKPLPATIFSEDQIEQAFRFMATGKHIGKVILKIREEESCAIQKPTIKLVSAIPRVYLQQNKSYVIIGGLGGFGLELTNWLIERGATKIVLISRSGITTGYQSMCVREWRERGVNVVILTTDVTIIDGVKCLLEKSNQLGPVGGIFNLAAVLRDTLIENQTEADFKTVCRPKIEATKNLDTASRALCPHLDYFIVFSSIASGRGNVGQVNYGFANSAMERICEARQAVGLPGLAIQWGPIGDVGLIIDTMDENNIDICGTLPQRISSCLQIMDNFMQKPYPVLASMVLAEKQKSSIDNTTVSLVNAIANILGIKDIKTIQPNVTLSDLGMDSIMGTEIKQILERNYALILNVQDIRALTFGKLTDLSTETVVAPIDTIQLSHHSTSVNVQHNLNWTEIIPSKSIIKMKSKATNLKAVALFVVHPIEGVVNSLEELVQQVEVAVYGLQCTEQAPLTSVQELAKFYVEQIQQVQSKGPYTICGYSFGAAVAFEMAVQLENVKEKVSLILLDGSPSYIASHNNKKKDTFGDVNLNFSQALTYFILQFKTMDRNKLLQELLTIRNQDKKLEKAVDILNGVTNFSPDQLKIAAISFFKKLLAADKYKPSNKFNGEVVLIKATETYVQLEDDYGLNSLCKQKVTIIAVEGNHNSILLGDTASKIANIINNNFKK